MPVPWPSQPTDTPSKLAQTPPLEHAQAGRLSVTRINQDGMDAGIVGAIASPEFAIGMALQTFNQLPGVAIVGRVKQAARQCAASQLIRLLERTAFE